MKELHTVIKQELREDEHLFIIKQKKLDDLNDSEWWKFDEYTIDEIFNNINRKEKVIRYWHEDGLCIILK